MASQSLPPSAFSLTRPVQISFPLVVKVRDWHFQIPISSPAGDYGLSLLLVIAGEITLLFPRAGFFSCSIPKIHGPGGAILSPGLAWQDMEKVGT